MTRKKFLKASYLRKKNGEKKNSFYSKEERKYACGYIKKEIDKGKKISEIAQELGISQDTVKRWSKKPEKEAGRFKRIEIVEQPRQSEPVLITNKGHRIEGLSLENMAELLGLLQ
jgi:transposase